MTDKILRIVLAIMMLAVVGGYFYMKSEEKRIQNSWHQPPEKPNNQLESQPIYSGDWKSPDGAILVAISKALSKNKVRDCGEYYYKPKNDGTANYLVAGTRNGKSWHYYIVKTNEGEVEGPLTGRYSAPY